MTEPVPARPSAGASDTAPAAPYLERVAQWLAFHDPGGIDTTRAVQLGLGFLVIIFLGYGTSRAFGLGLDIPFPMMGGLGALVLINFNPAASRRAEARAMVRLFLTALALLLLLWVVGPGEGAANELAQKLLLVPLSFLALLLRRYGMDGQRQGLALILVATIGTILMPKRMEAVYFIIAFCQGAAVMAAIRLSPWRPSALKAYVESALDMQDALAAYLREIALRVRAGEPLPPDASERVEANRTRVWNALANATAEAPEERVEFEHFRAKIYRLRVAAQLLASCIPDTRENAPDWRGPFSAAADHIARRLEAIELSDIQSEERFERAVARLKDVAMDAGLPTRDRFALLRAVTAFERLSLVVTAIAAAETRPFPPPHPVSDKDDGPKPPAPAPLVSKDADGRWTLSAPLKVACQGLVATAITTGFDLIAHLDHAYWATLTVMFVMGNSLGETYMRVRYRTLGTIIGVVLGIAAFLAFDGHIWLLAALCLVAQMVSVVTVKDRYDVSSAAVGFSVVLGLHLISGLGTEGMVARVYETAIGAGVALAVSYLVLPVYLTDQLRPEVRGLVKRSRDTFATWWPSTKPRQPVGPLVREVRALDMRVPQLGAEQVFGHSAGDVVNIVSTLDVLMTYLALFEETVHRLEQAQPKPEVVAAVETARSRMLNAFAVLLGESASEGRTTESPAMEAAVSMVLNMTDDPAVRGVLPLVADYLAYSDAALRPLTELRATLSDRAPWRREKVLSAGTTPPERP